MATNNLKFFHVTSWPEAASTVTGGIYFNKTTGEIAVGNGTGLEKYSGHVKDVAYDPVVNSKGNAVGGKLTITYFDGGSVELDFSDVASYKTVTSDIATALQAAKTYSDAKKINGKTGHEITLTGADVALTDYKKADTSTAIKATDTVNAAIGKLEKGLEAVVAGGVTAVVEGNGISVDATDVKEPKVSVKIDTASEKFGENAVLTAGADGLKISGIADKISAEINKLDYSDSAIANQYVSSVSEENGVITVTHTDLPVIGVADGDKILSLEGSKIGAGLGIKYNSTAKKIYLYGSVDDEAHRIGEVDCTDFIKDGMLDNATYDHATHKLTLTFNTAAGKENIDVDLSKLVDTYLAAGGITLDKTGDHPTFKLDLDKSSYLTVADGKLRFDDTAIHTKITGDIKDKVDTLNATKSNEETATNCGSTASSQIKVQVSEAAGVLTGVTVTAPVFAEPGDLDDLESKLIGSNDKDTKDSNTIWGAKKYADDKATAAQTNAETYTNSAIQKLDATAKQNETLTNTESAGIKAIVTEEDGKLTGVEVSIAPKTYAKPADITTAINDLNSSKSNDASEAITDPSNQIKVTVSEEKGKISAVTVNAPAFDLSGAATTAQTNAKTYTDEAIQALDATVDQTASTENGLALQVVEADGVITSVTGSMNWCEW